MKIRLTFLFVMMPTICFSQSLSPYGGWGGPPEEVEMYSAPDFYYMEEELPPWETQVQKSPDYGNIKIPIMPVAPDMTYYPNNETEGTIIIETSRKVLFYTVNDVKAYKYPIGVGREGFEWSGVQTVSRIQEWPEWTPPKEMLQRRPELPQHMAGGLKNPLGAVAIYLGDSLYRIHGTNDPKSIGKAESSGCIRMMNEHAVHLASMVQIGTKVKVYK